MNPEHPLRGSCSCGRNQYLIYFSSPASQQLQVLFDDTNASSKRNATHPMLQCSDRTLGQALSLRVPLSRLRSTTYALYPDESHHEIRRVFTPHHAPHTKRQFCGFCGTALSHWSEENREEAEWICVNLASLKNESVERLEEAGFLSAADRGESSGETTSEAQQVSSIVGRGEGREARGIPWFEEMVEGSELGRIKRRRGGQTSADGSTRIEWEVVEIGGDHGDSEATSTAKRKISKLEEGDDIPMRG